MEEDRKLPFSEIKHYMRRDARARDKSLVTERIEPGSATHQFLQRMEVRRKTRECVLAVDMRGKVPYECRRYNYRERVLWLDDISYGIFQRGLEENNGVFTVGVFEEIVNGEHTFKGMERHEQQNKNARPMTAPAGAASSSAALDRSRHSDTETPSNAQGREAAAFPPVIPLGYFRDRREARLQHSTEVLLYTDNQVLSLKTLDISARGLRVVAKHSLGIQLNQVVQVSFSQLNEEEGAALDRLEYRVVGIERTDYDFRLRLVCDQDDSPVVDFMRRYINECVESRGQRKKIDIEDERITAFSLLAELYYGVSTPTVFLFLSGGGQAGGAIQVDQLCYNKNCDQILGLFRDSEQGYDFGGLGAPERVRGLYDRGREDGQKDPLLAVFRSRDSGAPRVVGDFEFTSEQEWLAFLTVHASDQDFRLFKALVRPLQRPDCRKIYEKILRLTDRSPDAAEEIVQKLNAYVAVVGLADITEQMREWGLGNVFLGEGVVQKALPLAERLAGNTGTPPDLVALGYTEQRHEDRYRVSLAVDMDIGGESVSGTTRDISVRGFCVELAKLPPGARRGEQVRLTFPGLMKRAKQRSVLRDIPCEIVGVGAGASPFVALKRISDEQARKVTEFFQDLIERNAGRMEPDLTDAVTAARSRLYGSLVAESTATVPLFVYRDPESGDRIVNVALPKEPGTFAEFFEVGPGDYDFRALAEPQRISRLTGGLRKTGIAELVVYLYKKPVEGEARFTIHSAAECEFETAKEKSDFIEDALQYDFCFVKITVGAAHQPKDSEVQASTDNLMAQSPRRANKLQAQFQQLLAVGEIVDVTRQAMEWSEVGAGNQAG